jgi:predicted alpha/beta hydrolase family esterase
MKLQVLFIQGAGGGAHHEDARLAASLRDALGNSYEVRFPKMAAEADPDYQRWKPHLAKELAAMPDKPFLSAHSLGGSFLLKYLTEEEIDRPIRGLFLIATPFWGGEGWRYEGYERVALAPDFGAKLPPGMPVFLYHGRNDATVPFRHMALYAAKLPGATVRALDGRGHQLDNDLSGVAADIRSLAARGDAAAHDRS